MGYAQYPADSWHLRLRVVLSIEVTGHSTIHYYEGD